jgi:serpin B
MDRRHFLALLAMPLVAELLTACGGDSPTVAPVNTTDSARSDLVRVAADPSDAGQSARAIEALAADLYAELLAADPNANLVFSPASISLALTMTMAGALGETRTQMIDTLHIADPTTIHRAANALDSAVEASNSDDNTVTISNSLWGQIGTRFEQPFLDLLAVDYGAEVNLVDYAADAGAATAAINSWVDEQTSGRIPQAIGPDPLSADTRFCLVNAIYLKAVWASEFGKDGTVDAPFTTATGDTVDVAMMRQKLFAAYVSANGWRGIRLPYTGGELAMDLFIADDPDDASIPLGDGAPDLSAASGTEVVLSLPRFDFETRTSLSDQLKTLGMNAAFDPTSADFGGITTEERLFVADVIHVANITVDEQGTEAAAVTVVVGEATSAPSEDPVELTFERPFVFVIRHVTTGAALFVGRVTDPTQTRS